MTGKRHRRQGIASPSSLLHAIARDLHVDVTRRQRGSSWRTILDDSFGPASASSRVARSRSDPGRALLARMAGKGRA